VHQPLIFKIARRIATMFSEGSLCKMGSADLPAPTAKLRKIRTLVTVRRIRRPSR
jgi:hypothetical protein